MALDDIMEFKADVVVVIRTFEGHLYMSCTDNVDENLFIDALNMIEKKTGKRIQ